MTEDKWLDFSADLGDLLRKFNMLPPDGVLEGNVDSTGCWHHCYSLDLTVTLNYIAPFEPKRRFTVISGGKAETYEIPTKAVTLNHVQSGSPNIKDKEAWLEFASEFVDLLTEHDIPFEGIEGGTDPTGCWWFLYSTDHSIMFNYRGPVPEWIKIFNVISAGG